ncbi:MAG: hypothetical protein HY321_06975 [Armatimonadetes bacterium]|nr:hypothetical protein [Armatimonadota bacterium]
MTSRERVPTGIDGLDLILGGGVLRGHCVLVEGTPGSGKTTFGLQFIHGGILRHGEAGLVVTFEQSPEQIYRDAANFGWDIPALEAENRVRVVCTSPEVLRDQLRRPEGLLDGWIRDLGVRRMLIDGFSQLEVLAGENLAEQRALFLGLLNALKQRGLTVFVTREASEGEAEGGSFAGFISDAVVRVTNIAERWGERRSRYVEVLKTRGQEHVSGRHAFRFGPDGIRVFPILAPPEAANPPAEDLAPTGVSGLDHLLGGGAPRPASILVSGETGTGKTILGLQFLREGARRGEPGLLFLYQETPAQVARVAASFGWDLARLAAEGRLRTVYAPFAGLSLSEHLWSVAAAAREVGARRIVFDSLSAMLHEVSAQPTLARERTDHLIRLTKAAGATALFIAEVPAGSAQISTYGVEESLVDAVVLLRATREGARRRRGIEVHKMRGAGHVMGEHRIRITPAGIKVFYRPTRGEERDEP